MSTTINYRVTTASGANLHIEDSEGTAIEIAVDVGGPSGRSTTRLILCHADVVELTDILTKIDETWRSAIVGKL